MIDNTGIPFNAVADGKHLGIIPSMANRHGLIAGATGTGKTCTLQNLAETFSAMGVPVFATDIKGDLSGVGKAGGGNEYRFDTCKNGKTRIISPAAAVFTALLSGKFEFP